MIIPSVIGVNPLQTTLLELGIVSGRVALLLRSAEIQPGFDRFDRHLHVCPLPTFLKETWYMASILRTCVFPLGNMVHALYSTDLVYNGNDTRYNRD